MKSCKLKKVVKKHLKEDIKESRESISDDKKLMAKMKKKALGGSRRSQMAPKSTKKAKSKY